jgi:mRNA-degrading endonuclease RelE of RelBE toxin-antitoxin system
MVDKIQKALDKLKADEKIKIKEVLDDLRQNKPRGYDIKKLKGREDVYRIRKGKMRILYRVDTNGEIYLLAIERRSDNTYN